LEQLRLSISHEIRQFEQKFANVSFTQKERDLATQWNAQKKYECDNVCVFSKAEDLVLLPNDVATRQMFQIIEEFDKLPKSWLQSIKETATSFSGAIISGFKKGWDRFTTLF